jgi:hypothetical protein
VVEQAAFGLFEQRLNLARQFLVLATGFFQEHGATGRLLLQCGVVKLLDLPPAFRCHGRDQPAQLYHRCARR